MIQEMRIDDIDPNGLKEHIDRFPSSCLLVIGDIIMDRYIWGEVSRISPEAPVPVVDVRHETRMLGGSANVFNNITSLGGRAILCGVVGRDDNGSYIIDEIKKAGGITEGIITEDHRPTTIKTRIIAHNQQVVRLDREERRPVGDNVHERMLDFVGSLVQELDCIIIADYGKGIITPGFMEKLREVIADGHVLLAVDPKVGNFHCYKDAHIITPNHHEAGTFCQREIEDEETLIYAGEQIRAKLNCRNVLITQGKDGMTLFQEDGRIIHIPTVARKVFDVTGAGDTVVGTLCLGISSGMSIRDAAILSNIAAGIVVGEVGTSCVKVDDLKKAINHYG
jgi:D-beta-D-heptose 7-phosphate kinase/D-beta-D-heptose 1-phosphate adenosyltransferase